jgi:hypothetical protein
MCLCVYVCVCVCMKYVFYGHVCYYQLFSTLFDYMYHMSELTQVGT